MKIRFTRSGGLLGKSRTLNLDVNALNPEEQKIIRRLVKQSRAGLLNEQSNAILPDMFSYDIAIQDGHAVHALKVDQANITEETQKLIAWLERKLKNSSGPSA